MSSKLHSSNDRFSESAKSWFVAEDPLDLCEMAKIDHVLFKKRVVDVLMGREVWHEENVPNHHQCRLGKWYDNVKDPVLRQNPEFDAVLAPHAEFHAVALGVLKAHRSNDMATAFDLLLRLNTVSGTVINGLDALSKSCRSCGPASGAEPARFTADACDSVPIARAAAR
jgi:methyl-accepting chemotaxis protein